MTGTQLVLNGASSAGKTTLCRKLQEILAVPYILLEEDRYVFGTYHMRFVDGEMGPEIFSKTMLGYYRSLKSFLSAVHCALADTGFDSTDTSSSRRLGWDLPIVRFPEPPVGAGRNRLRACGGRLYHSVSQGMPALQ